MKPCRYTEGYTEEVGTVAPLPPHITVRGKAWTYTHVERTSAMVPTVSCCFCSPPPTIIRSSCSYSSWKAPCLHASPAAIANTNRSSRARRGAMVVCEVVLKQDHSTTVGDSEENNGGAAKIGAKVRVKAPLRVYHVPKVAELDLSGMEGEIKDYVAVWKGRHISANLPFKIQFAAQVDGRDIKFFAHLREDEFEYLNQ